MLLYVDVPEEWTERCAGQEQSTWCVFHLLFQTAKPRPRLASPVPRLSSTTPLPPHQPRLPPSLLLSQPHLPFADRLLLVFAQTCTRASLSRPLLRSCFRHTVQPGAGPARPSIASSAAFRSVTFARHGDQPAHTPFRAHLHSFLSAVAALCSPPSTFARLSTPSFAAPCPFSTSSTSRSRLLFFADPPTYRR